MELGAHKNHNSLTFPPYVTTIWAVVQQKRKELGARSVLGCTCIVKMQRFLYTVRKTQRFDTSALGSPTMARHVYKMCVHCEILQST